jgi:hypothetical protein
MQIYISFVRIKFFLLEFYSSLSILHPYFLMDFREFHFSLRIFYFRFVQAIKLLFEVTRSHVHAVERLIRKVVFTIKTYESRWRLCSLEIELGFKLSLNIEFTLRHKKLSVGIWLITSYVVGRSICPCLLIPIDVQRCFWMFGIIVSHVYYIHRRSSSRVGIGWWWIGHFLQR